MHRLAEAGAERGRHELGEHDGVGAGKRAGERRVGWSGEPGIPGQRIQRRIVQHIQRCRAGLAAVAAQRSAFDPQRDELPNLALLLQTCECEQVSRCKRDGGGYE